MQGVLSQQGSVMIGKFVGDPAAAGHVSSLKQAACAFKGFQLRRMLKRKGAE
jgi:hypothetical protein